MQCCDFSLNPRIKIKSERLKLNLKINFKVQSPSIHNINLSHPFLTAQNKSSRLNNSTNVKIEGANNIELNWEFYNTFSIRLYLYLKMENNNNTKTSKKNEFIQTETEEIVDKRKFLNF